MKNLFKKALKLTIICSLLILLSCEKDLYQENIKSLNNGRAEILSKKEAEKVALRLKGILGSQSSLNINSFGKTITLDFGTINYDQIIKIIDTYGKQNYSFQINYPEKSDTKFANLVLQEKDNYTTIKVVEYNMTDQFAQQYKLDADMTQFKGSIKFLPIFSDNPCPETQLIIQIGPIPPHVIGGGGGNNGDNSGGNTTNPGGSGYSDPLSATITTEDGDANQDDNDETGEWDSTTDWHSKLSIVPITPTDSIGTADPCPKETQIVILSPIDVCVKDFMALLNSDQKIWLYQQQTDSSPNFNELIDYVDGNGVGACSTEKNNIAKDYIDIKNKRVCLSSFSFSDVGGNWQNAGVSNINIQFLSIGNVVHFANIYFAQLHFGFPKLLTGGLYITNNNARNLAQNIMTEAEALTNAYQSINPSSTPTELRTYFYAKLGEGMAEFGGTISTSAPLGWTGTLKEHQTYWLSSDLGCN